MRKLRLALIWLVVLIMGVNLQACGSIQQMIQGTPTFTPTITLTPSPTATATLTSTPTNTPTPTATPDIIATQKYDDFFSWVEKFSDDGLISSVQGKYYPLDDYSKSFAKPGYYIWVNYDALKPKNFIMQANVKIANATTQNVSKSACGFVFDDVQAVFFALDGNANFRTGGADRGSNYLDRALYDNLNGVKITLLINNGLMYFFVNDQIGLSGITVRQSAVSVGPSVLSGTNDGFGTRCDFTDMSLWEIK